MNRLYRTACAVVFSGALVVSTPALVAQENAAKGTKSGADHKFVMEAAQGGMAEVELGRLAAEKASSDDVKKFGQRMVDDHTKANDQLKSVASQKGITLPSDIGAKNRAEVDRLSKLSGAAFDKAYMQHMTKDHRKDVAEFQKEANSGKDADVKNFAAQTLPTLQEHLKLAEQINGKVGSGGTTAGSADREKKQ